jgi:hypothetical protein
MTRKAFSYSTRGALPGGRQIEISTRRIGRAFWRDIKDSAKRAAQKSDSQIKRGSGMYAAFKELLELNSAIQIHVVAEGAGAILIGELIRTLDESGEEQSISRITTLTLLAPACTRAQFEQELLKWQRRRNRPILLLVPGKDIEMKVGFYQGSVLDLVERSFEEEVEEERVPSKIMGTAVGAADAEKQMKEAVRVRRLKAPETSKSIEKLRLVTFSDDAFRKIIEYWTECDSMLPRTKVIRRTRVED